MTIYEAKGGAKSSKNANASIGADGEEGGVESNGGAEDGLSQLQNLRRNGEWRLGVRRKMILTCREQAEGRCEENLAASCMAQALTILGLWLP